jgi:hypothetical protein
MTANSSGLLALKLVGGSSDCSKNVKSSKEELVTEEIKFRKFKELPLGIRLMVWKEVCFEARIVDIWGKPIRNLWKFGPARPFVYRSYSGIRSILHVSKELAARALNITPLNLATPGHCTTASPMRKRSTSIEVRYTSTGAVMLYTYSRIIRIHL